MPDPIKNPLPPKCIVLLCFVLLLFSSCLTQEQRKQKAYKYGNKGVKADDQGNYQDAITYYDKAINICDNIPSLYLDRGLSKLNMGDTVGAIEDYKKAFALDTTWEQPLYNLGLVYSLQNQTNKAIKIFNQALCVDSNSLITYLGLGIIYFNSYKYDSAVYYFENIALKYPFALQQPQKDYVGNSNMSYSSIISISYFYEGLCYKYLGNKKQAQYYLSLAMKDGVEGAKDSLNTLLK